MCVCVCVCVCAAPGHTSLGTREVVSGCFCTASTMRSTICSRSPESWYGCRISTRTEAAWLWRVRPCSLKLCTILRRSAAVPLVNAMACMYERDLPIFPPVSRQPNQIPILVRNVGQRVHYLELSISSRFLISHYTMTSCGRTAYFYDPDVGNFHYGTYIVCVRHISAGLRNYLFIRPGSPHEAPSPSTHPLPRSQLRPVQEDGGECDH